MEQNSWFTRWQKSRQLTTEPQPASQRRPRRGAFAEEYSPVGQRESDLVQSIADTLWRLKRIPCLESALFALGYVEFADAFEEHDPSLRPGLIRAQAFLKYEKQIRNLHLQESRLFRRFEKERAELRQLQQNRQANDQGAFEAVAAQEQATVEKALPAELLPNGFEFSTAEIEQSLAPAPGRAPATMTQHSVHPHSNAKTQAA